jgi:hypothetical protein
MARAHVLGAVGALALGLVSVAVLTEERDQVPTAERYRSASELVASLPACERQSVWGKYAGTAYDRCTFGRHTVSVSMGEPPSGAGPVLEGPGWTVTAHPEALAYVQRSIGGVLR